MYIYKFFLIMLSTVIIINFTACTTSSNIILRKDGLDEYYRKVFTEFRNAKGNDREKNKYIISEFFYQFRNSNLKRNYKKYPCVITKEAVIALMGEPDSICEFNPNRYRYITKENGRTWYMTIIFKRNVFDNIILGSYIK